MGDKRASQKAITLSEYEQRMGRSNPSPIGGGGGGASKPPQKTNRVLLIVLAVVVVAGLAFVGTKVLGGDDDKDTKTAGSATTDAKSTAGAAKGGTVAPGAAGSPCDALTAEVASTLAKQTLTQAKGGDPSVCRYEAADSDAYVEIATPPPTGPDPVITQANLDYSVEGAPLVSRTAACDAEQALDLKCVQVEAQPAVSDDALLVAIYTPQAGADSKSATFALVFSKGGKVFRIEAGTSAAAGDSDLEVAVGKAIADQQG